MAEESRPLYMKILEEYRGRILAGELKADVRLPSEVEVARSYGVSRITSKRAFEELEREGYIYRVKGSGSYVADRIKAGVNPASGARMKVIDIILPFDISQGRSIDIIQGANDYLQQNGFLLNIRNSNDDPVKEREILINSYRKGVDGLIYYPGNSSNSLDLLETMLLNNFPLVSVDKYCEGLRLTSVVSDNFAGSYEAVSCLISRGHTHIGYLSDIAIENVSSVRERFFGYCKALRDHGIEIRPDGYSLNYLRGYRNAPADRNDKRMPAGTSFNRLNTDCLKRIISGFLEQPNPITAIHTVNDYVAMYALKAALELGIKVPEELSLIGFDNVEFSQHLEVPLTTVEQDFLQMGYRAAETLAGLISGIDRPSDKIILPTRIIHRETVANIAQVAQTPATGICGQ